MCVWFEIGFGCGSWCDFSVEGIIYYVFERYYIKRYYECVCILNSIFLDFSHLDWHLISISLIISLGRWWDILDKKILFGLSTKSSAYYTLLHYSFGCVQKNDWKCFTANISYGSSLIHVKPIKDSEWSENNEFFSDLVFWSDKSPESFVRSLLWLVARFKHYLNYRFVVINQSYLVRVLIV